MDLEFDATAGEAPAVRSGLDLVLGQRPAVMAVASVMPWRALSSREFGGESGCSWMRPRQHQAMVGTGGWLTDFPKDLALDALLEGTADWQAWPTARGHEPAASSGSATPPTRRPAWQPRRRPPRSDGGNSRRAIQFFRSPTPDSEALVDQRRCRSSVIVSPKPCRRRVPDRRPRPDFWMARPSRLDLAAARRAGARVLCGGGDVRVTRLLTPFGHARIRSLRGEPRRAWRSSRYAVAPSLFGVLETPRSDLGSPEHGDRRTRTTTG